MIVAFDLYMEVLQKFPYEKGGGVQESGPSRVIAHKAPDCLRQVPRQPVVTPLAMYTTFVMFFLLIHIHTGYNIPRILNSLEAPLMKNVNRIVTHVNPTEATALMIQS